MTGKCWKEQSLQSSCRHDHKNWHIWIITEPCLANANNKAAFSNQRDGAVWSWPPVHRAFTGRHGQTYFHTEPWVLRCSSLLGQLHPFLIIHCSHLKTKHICEILHTSRYNKTNKSIWINGCILIFYINLLLLKDYYSSLKWSALVIAYCQSWQAASLYFNVNLPFILLFFLAFFRPPAASPPKWPRRFRIIIAWIGL